MIIINFYLARSSLAWVARKRRFRYLAKVWYNKCVV